jgi:hypothetical protein
VGLLSLSPQLVAESPPCIGNRWRGRRPRVVNRRLRRDSMVELPRSHRSWKNNR